ncbi:hypothetical protein [Povalibacter sp.]|uniref:hypothetical protein n=1 Tax=Povalibacter sp. TaxID=1962978 RepID=UPI002F3EA215
MKARHVPLIASAIFGLLCIPAGADTASDLGDAAARIQYAFYTQDARALAEGLALISQLDAMALAPGIQEYNAAYGQWKLAQIHAEPTAAAKPLNPGASNKAAQECVRQAKAARTRDPRMAEAYAIEAVCSAFGSTVLASGCAGKPLRTARELDSRNPRIRLIELLCAEKGEGGSVAYAQKLRDLVGDFETAPPASPGEPDWGQAEALVLLGWSTLQRGDARGARDIVERALVIAPDYRKAQELLQATATRPK